MLYVERIYEVSTAVNCLPITNEALTSISVGMWDKIIFSGRTTKKEDVTFLKQQQYNICMVNHF